MYAQCTLTHQLQTLAAELTVVPFQLLRLFPQLLVVSRDLLLGLDQVIVGQRLYPKLGIQRKSR
jgi:hypothetical protein